MTIRSRILTAGLPLIIIIAWAVLISVDSTRVQVVAAQDPDTPQPNTILHAVLVTALATATLLAGGTAAVLFLRQVIARAQACVEGRLDTLADTQTALADVQAQQADALTKAQARAEQTARDARAVSALDDTVELRYLMAAPIVRATAPVLAGTALRAAAPVQANGQVVNMSQTPAARRKRRRGGGQAAPQDPVPKGYLEDMSGAVELGRKIEAERRRRGPSPSPS